MGHEDFLVSLLRPLGVYDLSRSSVNRGELAAWGKALDGELARLDTLIREMSVATAESFGLESVEELLPYRPASKTTEERREALAALLRIGGDSFSLSAINDTLSGCGTCTVAAEGTLPGYVEISFPTTIGIPPAFDQLRTIVEDILPCHVEVTYLLRHNTWSELMAAVDTFGDVEATGKTWYGLSSWKL